MGNEEHDINSNNSEDSGFSFVKEKIKPKTRKRIKKILSVIGFALLAGIVFGVASRVAFLKMGDPVARLLGIEQASAEVTPEPTGTNRSTVTFPTNPVTPSPSPPSSTPTPRLTPTQAATGDPDPSGSASPDVTQEPTDAPTSTLAPTATDAPSPSQQQDPDDDGGEGGNDNNPTMSPIDSYVSMVAQMREVAGQVQDSLVRVYSVTRGDNWMGESIETKQELTGVLMGNDGVELLVMTDYNVIAAADRIEVELDSIYDAALYSFDKDTNIAIVTVPLDVIGKTKADAISYMQLGSSEELYKGEPVIAVGRPNGYYGAVEFGFISHTGIVSYITDGELEEFTTDIYLVPGGDGIVSDLKGRLVGLIPHADDETENLNRIIGIDSLKSLILRLLNGGGIPYFGIRSENIPEDIRTEMGIENGIYVNEAFAGSPAATAGIKKGDVIETINGETIETVAQFYELLLGLEGENELEVGIFRASRPDEPRSAEIVTLKVKE